MNKHVVTITETRTHFYEIELPDGDSFKQRDEARAEAQRLFENGTPAEKVTSLSAKKPCWEFASSPRPGRFDVV